MITTITEAMNALCNVERTLTAEVEGLAPQSIVEAYPFSPMGIRGELETPCFVNYVKLDSITGANSQRTRFYSIRSHLYLAQSGIDLPSWSLIAAEFHQQFLDAIGQSVMLADLNCILNVVGDEGGAEIPCLLTWNQADSHYGLEFLLNLQIVDGFEWGP